MFELILELLNSILKHGLTWAAAIGIVTALYRHRKTLLKILHRGNEQETQLDSIQRDIRAIKAHMGVQEWGADSVIGKSAPERTTGQTRKLSSPQAASVIATIARFYTRFTGTYLYQQRRMKMKSKLLSRKFLMALATGILIILNDGLDMGLDTETIMYVVGIVGGWILGEAGVDIARTRKEAKYDYSALDSVRTDSEGA